MADDPIAAPVADPASTPAPAADPVKAPDPAPVTADPAKAADPVKAADPTKEPAKDPAAAVAEPVDYAKALSEAAMPEGMKLDPALAKTGTELLAKHNISADAAKELASFFAQQQKAGADGNAKAFADQVATWKGDAEKATTPEERGTAKDAALQIFGKDELALLEHFGVTNRAGFIKGLAKVGKAIKDDQLVTGNAAALNGSGDARKSFPNSNMNP